MGMKTIAMLCFALFFTANGFAQACTTEYAPVCGADGITYSNACWAQDANVQVVDANGECENQGIPIIGWPQLPDLGPITGIFATAQETLSNIFQNVNAAEWALIFSLLALAFLFLRMNFYVQMLLKFAGVLMIVAVVAILFGVVNV